MSKLVVEILGMSNEAAVAVSIVATTKVKRNGVVWKSSMMSELILVSCSLYSGESRP